MAKVTGISPALFGSELQDILTAYALQCSSRIDESTRNAAKQLVDLTRSSAPRGSSAERNARPHFHTSIAFKKLSAEWFGASRYLWYVKKPNQRLTHLLAKSHRARNGRIVAANPFLQDALDSVLRDYEDAIRRALAE